MDRIQMAKKRYKEGIEYYIKTQKVDWKTKEPLKPISKKGMNNIKDAFELITTKRKSDCCICREEIPAGQRKMSVPSQIAKLQSPRTYICVHCLRAMTRGVF